METYLPDIVLVIFLIIAFIYGWQSGTIKVLAGVGSLILAYHIARNWSGVIAEKITSSFAFLEPSTSGGQLANLLSLVINTHAFANWVVELILFVVIFVVIRWIVQIIARVLTDILSHGLLGKINCAMGAVLAVLLMGVVIVIGVEIVLPVAAN
ncbi:MAG: CvpA family protein, partial [Clostridiales bacterium]